LLPSGSGTSYGCSAEFSSCDENGRGVDDDPEFRRQYELQIARMQAQQAFARGDTERGWQIIRESEGQLQALDQNGNAVQDPNVPTQISDDPDIETENNGVVLTFYAGSQELFVQGEVDSNGDRTEFVIDGVTSGKGTCMNNAECSRKRDHGPIPEGTYYLNVGELDEVGAVRAWFRSWTGDWGSFRVALIPFSGTDVNDEKG
jgi:hypothetical protein